ncbi:MAG TPA: phage tail protein [Telluria sp.]|nr:phage tail protein [Telluria sp.]
MSGQQIGTVVGGAIGAYFGAGNPAAIQLGMAIGGTIGGLVDPTRINGPHLGDGQQQTATDGAPIAWVLGTALVAGTLVQVSSRREVKIKDSGKGGPVVSHYEGRQDFAILVCESCSLRSSTMASVLMVLQDGVIVYDVRPGSGMLSASYKFAQGVDFMFGDEAQLPHPTLEAITGVGNTPSYRGSLIAVFKNFNTSKPGGRIPTFHFLVAASATTSSQLVFASTDNFRYFLSTGGLHDGLNAEQIIEPYGAFGFDDSVWSSGPGSFGNFSYYGTFLDPAPLTESIWIRKSFTLPPLTSLTLTVLANDWCMIWLNGHVIHQDPVGNLRGLTTFTVVLPVGLLTDGTNIIALKGVDDHGGCLFGMSLSGTASALGANPTLAAVASEICIRGGLGSADIDVTALASISVAGYPVARVTTGSDALAPLLSAYFAFASERDTKLVFDFYGANVAVTIDRADLIEGNGANHDAVKWTKRNQATEFPRRVVGSYMDPVQNYTIVDVAAERRAAGVIAIGDQSFAIPVVMAANDAAQAVDKALKVAYATLEGTAEYSVPFAGSADYLSLTAGDPVWFLSKRYVLDDMVLSNGYLKLVTRYDRQDAYTSNIQAIPGNAPSVPPSPYSGPTTLIPMNLPALRPQDSVGIYVAAGSSIGSPNWRGCDVQISYDGMATWQTATQINSEAAIGQFSAAEPSGGEPLTVRMFAGDLFSATSAQLQAQANVFAIVAANGVSEVGQFMMTVQSMTVANSYTLTGISRALASTQRTVVTTAMRFAQLDAAYFIPIDPAFAGRTLYLRGVGFGSAAEEADIEPIIFTAIVASRGFARIAEDGTARIAENGVDLRFTEN